MPERKTRLLLVEDDDVDRAQVRRLLGGGYAVREAATSAVARRLFQAERPDGVLLDYRLPDADGLELLPLFTGAHVPVVVLTGEESPEVVVEAMRRGAQDYLVKGHLSAAMLQRAVANALEKGMLQRELAEKQQKLAEHAAALERKNREVRSLATALTLAEQQERHRIARVLHDDLQQQLYGAQLKLQMLRMQAQAAEPDSYQATLGAAYDLVSEAIRTSRQLTVDLSPPVLQGEGLAKALRWLGLQMEERYGLHVEVTEDGAPAVLDEDLRVLFFQLVRELLFNVVKHAQTDHAHIRLHRPDHRFCIDVEDEGAGFDPRVLDQEHPASGGFGLHSVRRRLTLLGGQLHVTSSPGTGTRVAVSVPAEVLQRGR